jgi:hypothetical protein
MPIGMLLANIDPHPIEMVMLASSMSRPFRWIAGLLRFLLKIADNHQCRVPAIKRAFLSYALDHIALQKHCGGGNAAKEGSVSLRRQLRP